MPRPIRTGLAAVRRPWLTVSLILTMPLAGFGLAGTLGNQFFPPADRDQFEIEVWLPSDASIARSAGVARDIEALVRARPGIERVDWLVGGSFPSVYYNLIMDQDDSSRFAHAIVVGKSVAQVNDLIPLIVENIDTLAISSDARNDVDVL